MTTAVDNERETIGAAMLRSPLLVLALVLAVLAVLLTVPFKVPIGPMYWDLFIYFDAANRILDGQIPVVDFFAPVGPLGYYLFTGALEVFPSAQPALMVHWSLLAVTAPLMALVLWDVNRRSATIAFALLVPFLAFAVLPFNTRDYYPFPGSDAFGIYNRQVCQLLYVLVAALTFARTRAVLATVAAACMTALFFTKITGFASGGIICAFAFMSGRLTFRDSCIAALAFGAVLGLLELQWGLVSTYIRDILALVALNSESLAPRFLQAASHTFGIVAPAGLLLLLLLWVDRSHFAERYAAFRASPGFGSAAGLLDHNALWLGVVLLAGIFFETQNTGSQALIFAWPVILAILTRSPRLWEAPRLLITAVVLAAAAMLPPVVNTVERAARTYLGAVKNVAFEQKNLKTLGAVNLRQDVKNRANTMHAFYPGHIETYDELTAQGMLPSFIHYSDYDFQILHLMAIDDAVDSIRALEAEHGIRFETIMALNFVNPFPHLMDRSAPKHIAIGADPTRAVPDPGSAEGNAVRDTDLILLPRCPPTTANAMLLDLYASALTEHRRIALDACYDAFVHPRLADRLDGR